jgi:hypothetical protein
MVAKGHCCDDGFLQFLHRIQRISPWQKHLDSFRSATHSQHERIPSMFEIPNSMKELNKRRPLVTPETTECGLLSAEKKKQVLTA